MSAEPVWDGPGYYQYDVWKYTHGSNCGEGGYIYESPKCFIFNAEPTCNVYGGDYPDVMNVLVMKCTNGCNVNTNMCN